MQSNILDFPEEGTETQEKLKNEAKQHELIEEVRREIEVVNFLFSMMLGD